MRVDSNSITRQQAKAINEVLEYVVNHPKAKETKDNSTFINGTYGGRSIELLVGGELYVVHERDELYPLILEEPSDRGHITHVGSTTLFNECLDYSVWRED